MHLFDDCYSLGKNKIIEVSKSITLQLQYFPGLEIHTLYTAYSKIQYLGIELHSKILTRKTKSNSFTIR